MQNKDISFIAKDFEAFIKMLIAVNTELDYEALCIAHHRKKCIEDDDK